MKKLNKTASLLILAVLLTGVCAPIAIAYSLMTNGYWTSSIDMKFDSGLTSDYRTATSNAISAWNSKNISPVNYNTKLDSANTVYQTLSLGTNKYGQYSSYNTGSDPNHTATRFDITYCTMYCEGFNKTYKTPQSTGVHELGHAAGLDDLSSGSCIMNSNRDRESIYTPKTDDVNGVNASW